MLIVLINQRPENNLTVSCQGSLVTRGILVISLGITFETCI